MAGGGGIFGLFAFESKVCGKEGISNFFQSHSSSQLVFFHSQPSLTIRGLSVPISLGAHGPCLLIPEVLCLF